MLLMVSLFFLPEGDGEIVEHWMMGKWVCWLRRSPDSKNHRSGEEIHEEDLEVSSPINSKNKEAECWNSGMEYEQEQIFPKVG